MSTNTSILGDWPVAHDFDLKELYTLGPLIVTGNRIQITEAAGKVNVNVFDGATPIFSGEVSYHNGNKDSIHGKLTSPATGVNCYISAYARRAIDSDYIFGTAVTRTGAADSGGQWDGNRPR